MLDHCFWNGETVAGRCTVSLRFSRVTLGLKLEADSRSYPDSPYRQRYLGEGFAHHDEVACLYSGGLDSAAGLVARLRSQDALKMTPVTVVHRSDIGSQSRSQLAVLQKHFNGRLSPIAVPFEFRRSERSRKREPSQRTRSFLFASVGFVVAASNDQPFLEAFESGIGAFNTPLMGNMRGSQATRGMSPYALDLMSDIASRVFDKPFRLSLPFAHQTKAEVVRALHDSQLGDLARETVSCVHYPVRNEAGKGHRQCGVCPACLFRRVALAAAGIDDPAHGYKFDVLDPSVVLAEKEARPLVAFLNQVDAINANTDAGLPAYVASHLRRIGVLKAGGDNSVLADLYRRYAAGWAAFIRQGRRNGCHWTKLIDARSAAA
ncbi:MAG: 7-cyano-7-deazaguanine synthase [Pirellulales bacterium]